MIKSIYILVLKAVTKRILSVRDISIILNTSYQRVYYIVKKLCNMGVIEVSKKGRYNVYTLLDHSFLNLLISVNEYKVK